MPYTLRKTNGTTLAIIQDGSIDTTTDLVFVGKNYAGYGQTVNENFLKLLENFSSSRFPEKPLTGQLWFDTANLKLKMFDGNRFKALTVTEIDSKRPSDLRQGDQWFDPIDQKLYVYNGVDYVMIGPEKTAAALVSAITGISVPGNDNNTYSVLQATIDTGAGSVIAAFTKQSFEPAANSDYDVNQHFVDLKRGISLPGYTAVQGSFDSTVIGAVPDLNNLWTFFGSANSAWGMLEKDQTGSSATFYDAKEYIRRSIGDSLSLNGPLQTSSNDGVTLGVGKIVKLHVDPAWGNTVGNLTNLQGTRLNFNVTTLAYGTVNALSIDYNSGTLLLLPNNTLASPKLVDVPVDIGTETQRFRSGYFKNIYAGKLSTSTNGIIEGTWTLAAGSSIVGGSVNATSATTSSNAVLLQGDDLTNFYHASTSSSSLSILQRDSNSRIWTSGLVAPNNSYFYGTWRAGTGSTVQATVLAGENNAGFLSCSTGTNAYTIVQRDGTGVVRASSITTPYISAGSLSTSQGQFNGAWQLTNGSTLQATYSDIAERYAADKIYDCGTVLIIGGIKEVTTTDQRANPLVAGIVSTNPAFKLNSAAGDDLSHPYIALKGRVPCKVRGPVNKGDRLVTSGTLGHAEVFQAGDDPGAVLGIALSGTTLLYDVIEVIVK